jgi:hypothetical protein
VHLTDRVVDRFRYLLELHENNAIITYSGRLSSQITLAHAADAFNAFRWGLHQFEIVRCARCGTHRRLTRKERNPDRGKHPDHHRINRST